MTPASLTAEIERVHDEFWRLNSVERRFAGDARRKERGRPPAEVPEYQVLAAKQEARVVELALELTRLHRLRAHLWAARDLRELARVRYSEADKTKCNPASPPNSNTSSATL